MEFLQSTLLPTGLCAMLAGMVLLYAAAQSMSGISAKVTEHAPARRAFWYAMPIGAAAVVATSLSQGTMALEILTGSAIAALSLAPGISRVISPQTDARAGANSLCGLILGSALLLWLIGLRAEIDWVAGILLAVQGIYLLCIWLGSERMPDYSVFTILTFVLAIAVALLAAELAIKGAVRVHDELGTLTPAVFAAGILAPILILPLLGESVRLTEEHRGGEAHTLQVGVAMVSLSLIPLCVLVSYIRPYFDSSLTGGPLPFSVGAWRIDSVLLVVLALWVLVAPPLPRAAARIEGIILIILYGAYLISLARVEMYL